MPKYLFLLPIGENISGQLIEPLLNLKAWCEKNDGNILTVVGKPHNFARNYLATCGKGFIDPQPAMEIEWFIWLDSDILFTIDQLDILLKINHPFVSGWYISDLSKQVMAGKWDIEYFKNNKHMPYLDKDKLIEIGKTNPDGLVEVDYTGFGFVKMHTSLIRRMKYPYFTLNIHNINEYTDISTEDVSFCQNCYDQTGIKPVICPLLHVGHLKKIFLY